jgi:VWFA-related protein
MALRHLAVLVLTVASGVLSAQPQPGRGAAPVGALEPVDFMAVSEDGRPVSDLTASDVTFKVDGRVREIRTLEFIELASPDSNERLGVLTAPIPVPYSSNRLADGGRVVMIVINHESIRAGRERPARDAAMRFLATLSPRDQVGLVTMPRGRVEVDLTRDHEEIKTALQRITGQAQQTASLGMPAVPRAAGVTGDQAATSDRACSARLTLSTLTGLLQSMATRSEGPKTLVFISTGLAPPTRDGAMTGPPGQCEIRSVFYDEVGTAASAARAHFYVIQPNDEQPDSASNAFTNPSASRFGTADEHLMGLQNLAGVTGGEIFRLASQNPAAVFKRLSHESSGYYVISFNPEPGERNGQPHRIEIRVTRARVLVRSSPHFTIPKPELTGDVTPQKMMRAARNFRGLALRATAYTSRVPGESLLKVVAAGEPMDPSVRLKSAAVGVFDAKGKLSAQSTADAKELASMPFIAALPVPTGPYRLRFAAVDTAGYHGTVDYWFRADLTNAGALKLSDIALGVSNDGAFVPKLLFGSERAAVGLLEIYGSPRSSTEITVRLELALSEDGPPLAGVPANVRVMPDGNTRLVVGAIPIESLDSGDYIVRAVVNVDGRPAARVYRTLRKSGR